MNQKLSTKAKIEQAAKAHAKKSTAPDKGTPDWIEQDFTAGVEWATTDPLILEAMLQPFGQWLLEKAWVVTKGVYEIDGEKGQFTMEELIAKYLPLTKR